jgi:hypothetical protein
MLHLGLPNVSRDIPALASGSRLRQGPRTRICMEDTPAFEERLCTMSPEQVQISVVQIHERITQVMLFSPDPRAASVPA